jgi:hypothetical protein
MKRLKSRCLGIGLVVALVCLALAGVSRVGVAGTDPEPWIDPNQATNFEKGPGWPAGWAEPAAPTVIPQTVVDQYKQIRGGSSPEERPERLEMRSLSPLPGWTREYPFSWEWRTLVCGRTMYAYTFPHPDTGLIRETFGKSYAVSLGPAGGQDCQFSPVVAITSIDGPTPEEKEQLRLSREVSASIGFAKGNLSDCHPQETDGVQDQIHVCFNSGNASERFDVPAYLDLAVGRVRVPIRFVSEMMGATVDWEPTSETVTIHFPSVAHEVITAQPRDGFAPLDIWMRDTYSIDSEHVRWAVQNVSQPERTITLRVGEQTAMVDGKEVKIDAPPVVLPPGRTMVPVRFIAEAMGAKVYWVGQDPIFKRQDDTLGGRYQVHIYTQFWPYYGAPSWFLETRAVKF